MPQRQAGDSQLNRGVALQLLSTKTEDRQACPLTVAAVRALEECACTSPPSFDAILAGAACFTIHARTRCGYLAESDTEPTLDVAANGSVAGKRDCHHRP